MAAIRACIDKVAEAAPPGGFVREF
jgi:hypothetical protein